MQSPEESHLSRSGVDQNTLAPLQFRVQNHRILAELIMRNPGITLESLVNQTGLSIRRVMKILETMQFKCAETPECRFHLTFVTVIVRIRQRERRYSFSLKPSKRKEV